MDWIAWIILGGIAGWIASMLTNDNQRMGILANIAVGILGAFAGTFILKQIGIAGISGFNLYSLLVAVGGAVLVLFLFSLIRGRSR